jgi:diguanylate cyclase (GGDEF)-like protein
MTENRLRNYWRIGLLSAAGAMLVAMLLLLGWRWAADREQMRSEINVQANLVGANLTAALVFGDDRTATEILGSLQKFPIIVEAAVYRSDGGKFAHYARAGEAHRLEDRVPPVGDTFTFSELRVVAPVELESRVVGTLALRVTLDSLYQRLWRYFIGMLLIAALAAIIGNFASRRLRLRMAAAEQELERMSLYDSLTGLANRNTLELGIDQELHRLARDGGSSALLLIDVDDFKKIGDRLGRSAANTVLVEIGARLKAALRGGDLVARPTETAFAILLTNLSMPEEAARVAEHLIGLTGAPFDAGGEPAHVGFTIGIAMLPHDGATAELALRHADIALQHARRMRRKNYQFFSASMADTVSRRLDVEAKLRVALEKDELYLVYQPQFDRHGGRIYGLEALVRWRHPQDGIISPMEFIPIAEESDLILGIGQRVIEMACREIATLRREGRIVPPVAINVSAHQISRGSLVDDIGAALARHGLPPEALEIELTETVLVDRLDERVAVFSSLAEQGIHIAIDDFGTGYSSLAYLRSLPVSKLKIDMSFVRDLPDGAEALTIVRGIIGMGHAMGLRIVAEGVESASQAECLKAEGCDLLQGYHIGLPVRMQEIELFLEPD